MRPDAISSSSPEASETDLISIFAMSIAISFLPLAGSASRRLQDQDVCRWVTVSATTRPRLMTWVRSARLVSASSGSAASMIDQVGDAAGLRAVVVEPHGARGGGGLHVEDRLDLVRPAHVRGVARKEHHLQRVTAPVRDRRYRGCSPDRRRR